MDRLNLLVIFPKKNFVTKNKEIMILSTTKPSDKGKNLIVGLVTTHIPLKEFLIF